MRFFILTLSSILLFCSCKSTKEVAKSDSQPEVIVFGNGGGFSGKVTHYTLKSNGEFYKGINKEGKFYTYPKLDESLVTQIFKNYNNLKLPELELYESGNMYKFLNVTQNGDEHKIMWGDSGSNPPEKLRIYFNNLMAIARKANTSTNSNSLPVK